MLILMLLLLLLVVVLVLLMLPLLLLPLMLLPLMLLQAKTDIGKKLAARIKTTSDRGILLTMARLLVGTPARLSLILDAKHGLGSRMRAYSSAKTIADTTSRFFVVVWEKDPHCQAALTELFLPPAGVHVVDNGDLFHAMINSGTGKFKM